MAKTVICKDVFQNEYKVPVDELELRVGVYAVIIENDKILLTRQWDGYSLIGGGLERGETIEEAIVREVKEESGLDVEPGEVFFHATTFFKRNPETPARQSVQLYLNHKKISGKINHNENITASEKTYTVDVPEWVDVSRLGKIKFRHSVDLDKIIDAYERGRMKNGEKTT